jgi:hypothetical protein
MVSAGAASAAGSVAGAGSAGAGELMLSASVTPPIPNVAAPSTMAKVLLKLFSIMHLSWLGLGLGPEAWKAERGPEFVLDWLERTP